MQAFHAEGIKAERRRRIDRIDDINAAHAGGKHAEKLKRDLEN